MKIKTKTPKIRKTGRILLRGVILALIACVLIFAGVIISDYIFSDDSKEATPEIIAITVSGKDIILGDDRKVTFSELTQYLAEAESKGELYTVALINDTSSPADVELYNQIVDLLAEYDIVCEKLKQEATVDEIACSTVDEVSVTSVS